MMVNNSTNINQANNTCHNKSWNTKIKKTTTHDIGNQCPGLGQAQKYEEVKTLNVHCKHIKGVAFVARGAL